MKNAVVKENESADEMEDVFDPQYISLTMKTWGHIHRDAPDHYISPVDIDILYGDEQKKIGEAKAFEVLMEHFINDGCCSLFDVFDCYAEDIFSLYEELFVDDELLKSVADDVGIIGNIVIIKSIILLPEYRGKGLGGILALAIAERFKDQDIVALKPWPLNSSFCQRSKRKWKLPHLSEIDQKQISRKLRKSYMKAGFKPLFRGSNHLFLTHYRHPTVTQLINRLKKKNNI